MTDKYVGQIKEWPQPTSGKELATALIFFGYYRDFLPQFAELTAEMNEVKTKRHWEADTWTPELQSKFQQIKDLFTDPAGGSRAHPMALGEPGAGEYILITEQRGGGRNPQPGTARESPGSSEPKEGNAEPTRRTTIAARVSY